MHPNTQKIVLDFNGPQMYQLGFSFFPTDSGDHTDDVISVTGVREFVKSEKKHKNHRRDTVVKIYGLSWISPEN